MRMCARVEAYIPTSKKGRPIIAYTFPFSQCSASEIHRKCQLSLKYGVPGGNVLRGNSYLKVVQKVPKCDVTLLSIDNSDWSQKGKFNSCNIITLDV